VGVGKSLQLQETPSIALCVDSKHSRRERAMSSSERMAHMPKIKHLRVQRMSVGLVPTPDAQRQASVGQFKNTIHLIIRFDICEYTCACKNSSESHNVTHVNFVEQFVSFY